MATVPLSPQMYERLIAGGIRGLSADLLAEIADFVFFLRKRSAEPEAFQDELTAALLGAEMMQVAAHEWAHLESEIDGYEQQYPHA